MRGWNQRHVLVDAEPLMLDLLELRRRRHERDVDEMVVQPLGDLVCAAFEHRDFDAGLARGQQLQGGGEDAGGDIRDRRDLYGRDDLRVGLRRLLADCFGVGEDLPDAVRELFAVQKTGGEGLRAVRSWFDRLGEATIEAETIQRLEEQEKHLRTEVAMVRKVLDDQIAHSEDLKGMIATRDRDIALIQG